jgi:threonine/homoserine/homoserine lactone efflux protein
MLPTHHLVAFLITVYVLILIPGPSVLFVVSRGVALGRRAAVATALGNESGFLLQLVLVSIGVGSLVARSDAVFTTLKLLGAAYLVFLGIRNIRDRKQLATLFAPAVAAEPKPLRRIYREGFFVGATNPKGIIIFTAVLPQFVDRAELARPLLAPARADDGRRRRGADRARVRPRADNAQELSGE